MNKNILILGAGQYGQVAREIAEAMGCFEKIDFLDDVSNNSIGKMSEYEKFVESYKYVIVAIGNADIRLEWLLNVENSGYEIVALIHPQSYISPSAQVKKGCIVEPMAVVSTGCQIDLGCIISAGAVVNHNAVCFAGVHVDCNATVAANAVVPAGEKVHSGTVFDKN